MGILPDFTLPGSDPTAPNQFVRTPAQVAQMQALAAELAKNGADYSPVKSPWQGAARLAQALSGAFGNYQADQAQRLGMADKTADVGNVFGLNPGDQNIPATPGQTTPALQESDARNDALSDGTPNAALAAALGAGVGTARPSVNPALVKALGYAPSGGAGTPGGYDYAMPTNGANASGLNPAFADRAQDLQQDAADAGIPSTLISGARSNDLQAKLFANYQARKAGLPLPFPQEGTGGMAAPPGGSYHNFGNAADIVTNNPAQQGALTDLAREPWRGITPGANFGDYDHYQIAGPINTGAGASPSALGAIRAATHSAPVAAPNAPAYAPVIPSPSAAGASPMGGPQGAGAFPSPAPSQANNAALAAAIRASQAPQGGDVVPSANAAAPYASSALAAAAGLHAPNPSAPQFAPSQPQPNSAPAPAPQQMAGGPAPAPSAPPTAAPQPFAAATPNAPHPDMAGLMRIMSNPWASPGEQQLAQSVLQMQMPTPPTYGVIGEDAITGNKQYGWINPRAQTVTPVNGGASAGAGAALPALPGSTSSGGSASAGGASASSATPSGSGSVADALKNATPNGLTPQGAQFLDAEEAQGGSHALVARAAREIIMGNAALPDATTAATKPVDAAIRDAVFRAAPQFNVNLANARADLLKQFASHDNPTSPGGIIDASQKGLHHLNALADSADKLAPGDWSLYNRAAQLGQEYWKGGNPALKEFDINRRALADELAKLYKGGVASEGEINGMLGDLQAAQTPGEMRAVFAKVGSLLTGVTDTYQSRWKSLYGEKSDFPIMQKENEGVLKRFQGDVPGAAAVAPTGGRTPPSAAVQHLQAHPELRQQFDQKYGPGASAKVLGNG